MSASTQPPPYLLGSLTAGCVALFVVRFVLDAHPWVGGFGPGGVAAVAWYLLVVTGLYAAVLVYVTVVGDWWVLSLAGAGLLVVAFVVGSDAWLVVPLALSSAWRGMRRSEPRWVRWVAVLATAVLALSA